MITRWEFYDTRTGEGFGLEVFRRREYAQLVLDGYRARDRRGGRPDLHDTIPHIEIRPYRPESRDGE